MNHRSTTNRRRRACGMQGKFAGARNESGSACAHVRRSTSCTQGAYVRVHECRVSTCAPVCAVGVTLHACTWEAGRCTRCTLSGTHGCGGAHARI
eukprot:6195275-Pleurochrysis_carterae.AAC.2